MYTNLLEYRNTLDGQELLVDRVDPGLQFYPEEKVMHIMDDITSHTWTPLLP